MSANFIKTIKNSIKYWWVHLLVGILFILTGIYTFTSPLESYLALAIFFSVTFLVSGLMEIFFAISNREEMDGWGWALVMGILTTIVGGMLVQNPALSMATLPLYVGFIIMFRSFNAIGVAMDLKHYGANSGSLTLLGVLGVILSFFMVFSPSFGGMTIVVWTGIGFLTLGILGVLFSFKLKQLKDKLS